MTDDWEFFEQQFECPVCKSEDCVPPVGNIKSKILIVAEFPGEKELEKGIPMVGNMGFVLRQELGHLGLDLKSTRRCNLWQHPPNKNQKCLETGMKVVIEEAKGKQAILLLGDDVVKVFIDDRSVMKISGLRVKSSYFSAPIIIACPNPALVFHKGRGIGEVRLALSKFVKAIKESKNE